MWRMLAPARTRLDVSHLPARTPGAAIAIERAPAIGDTARTDARRRVLFVGAFPPAGGAVFGGAVSCCRGLVESSLSRAVDLTLLDSTQASLPAPPLPVRAALAARRCARFARALRQVGPDALLLFASGGFSFLEKASFAVAARAAGIPSVLSVRSGHFTDQVHASSGFRALASLLLRASGCTVMAQGETARRVFVEELGVPPERCTVVENWLGSPRLLDVGSARVVRTGAPLRVQFLGWLEPFKGIDELLDATAALARDPGCPRFEVRLAGHGSLRAAAEVKARRLGIGDRVVFEGVLGPRAKEDALERADVLVLPSHTEGLPNAMLEGMAAALPVVVTPVGSIPDVVAHGVNGLVVRPRDAAALAGALRDVLRSPELRRRLGAAAHATATARFSPERAAAQVLELLVPHDREPART
jgi:glycosyltransferase involved in cell wall biosynthesis